MPGDIWEQAGRGVLAAVLIGVHAVRRAVPSDPQVRGHPRPDHTPTPVACGLAPRFLQMS